MEFLRQVTSPLTTLTAKHLITGPSKTRKHADGTPMWDTYWVNFKNDTEVQRAIEKVSEDCHGVYFALGNFKPTEDNKRNRKAVNCISLRSFWLDIDCGEEKWQKHGGKGCYRTREEAQEAFAGFLESTGLPKPTHIVSSGAGYHIYWQLDRDLPRVEWHQLALQLKAVCARYGFMADGARTADASSVLRVPNTLHKSGALVQIIKSFGTEVSVEHFKSALQVLLPYIQDPKFQQQMDTLAGIGVRPSYLDNEYSESTLSEQEAHLPKKFANLINKSKIDNTGCKQIYEMYLHQERVPEPMWTGALSIAKFCVDGDEWAIKISENHPEFDPEMTRKKLQQWDAPRTCKWFSEANPSGCAGCPLLRNIQERPSQSPIVLAIDDNRGPVIVQDRIAGDNGTGELDEFVIPSFTFPYYRKPDQPGVWIQSTDGDDKQIIDLDLYIYERIGLGVDSKPRFWARYHTPYDGVMEVELTSDDIYSTPAEMLKRLAAHNILLAPDANIAELNRYLRSQAAMLQRTRKMLSPPKQMGWTEKGEFALGRWLYNEAGRKMSPVPNTNIAELFKRSCEVKPNHRLMVDGWNEGLRKLYGAEDAEFYRLILACGFGSPVRSRWGREVGGVINIYSEDSGFGKSTLTKVISGIYAQDPDPFFYQARQGTTINAFFDIISYVNNLPLTLDETGQLDVEDLMLFVHTCTAGRAKARSSHQLNDIRQSLPGWKTHVFSSSNVSLWNRITETRTENEAYLMRILEVPVKALEQSKDKTYGDQAVKEIQQFYGVAGPIFIEALIQRADEIEALWEQVSEKLSADCKLHGRHRFWADILVSGIVGAKIAGDAGVFPFSYKEIYKTAVKLLRSLLTRATTKSVSDQDLLGELINHYVDHTLVVHDLEQSTTALKSPQKGKAFIRLERVQRKLFIDNTALREFAKLRSFGIERLEKALELIGATRGVMKQMWANTEYGLANPVVRAWEISLDTPVCKSLFGV